MQLSWVSALVVELDSTQLKLFGDNSDDTYMSSNLLQADEILIQF